jgi:hypothetical protein
MKKILSFVLVLAMIASMMCISVSAATCNIQGENGSVKHPNVDHVVGTKGDNGATTDGVDAGTWNSTSMVVRATVNGNVTHKYAVDLEYTSKTITIHNNAVWDVNELKYVGTMQYTFETVTENFNGYIDLTNTPVYRVGEFEITNYSDQPVYVSATVQDGNSDDGITTIVTEDNNSYTSDQELPAGNNITFGTGYGTVGAVTHEHENERGTETVKKYQAQMSCEDGAWVDELFDYPSNSLTIATITFTISSTTPNQTPAEGEGAVT